MKLDRLTERIYVYPFEEARDRPNLGYIRGDRWSIVVDAGHSKAHTAAFYDALSEAGLPLPAVTVLTHWHWDHTFGMHAIHGLSLANSRTNRHLMSFRERLDREGTGFFLALDERILREYADGAPVVVVPADMLFQNELTLDPGGCPVRVFQADSPHTDDATLIHVPGEGVLFMGDSACGAFPTWFKDPAPAHRLAATVEATGAALCLQSHWTPQSRTEMVRDLLEA